MKPWWLAVLGITLASVPAMSAGITVVYPRSAQVQVPGATAAYSLDPINADASAAEGVVTIIAKNPGEAKIVIVTLVGVQTLSVTILQPPPSYPPGFVPPTQVSYFGENGTYEFRYSSDPAQWQNNLSFVRRQGSRRVEFRLSNANLLGQTSDSHISFPLLSYSVSTRRREFTILDETVDNSSLTVNGAIVRGFHYRQGGWSFHGGVASLTSFQGLLLSTDREGVAGLSRSFRLGHKSELVANLYGFQMQRKTTAAGRSGAVGSVLFRQRLSSALDYSVELGFSRGIAGAGQIQYSDGPNHLHAQFRVLPQKFAGLGINDLRGRTVTADGSRVFNDRLTTSFSLNAAGYNLANLQQSTMNLQGLVRYRLWRHWSVNSGVGQSSFTSKRPVTSQVETMSVPIGTDFATAHFGVGLEYQYQHNTHAAKPGRDIRVNARTGFKSVQVTGFAERQTQAPTLVTALPPNSPLTDTLANQNVLATTPQGLAAAERDNALLAGLGYVASQDLAVALRRTQLGGSLNWMSHGDGHDQLAYNFLHSKDEYSDRSLVFASHTLTYSRRITSYNDVGLSLTAFSASGTGQGSDYRLRYEISLRHRFSTIPSFLAPGGHGAVSGHVFRDDNAGGEYTPASPAMADVEVVLDGTRHLHTNDKGFYNFDHVPAGAHRVEVIPGPDAHYYFTTASSVEVEINSTVNFGIALASAQIFGFIRSDAGEAIAGVTIHLEREGQQLVLQSGDDGKFERGSLPRGTYTVSVDANSFPAGYWLAGLKKQMVFVRPGEPGRVDIQVKASRSVSGRVVAYDVGRRREVPLPGAVVTLRELRCAVLTDKNGLYRFKDLPAGNYTISVVHNGREFVTPVHLSGGPTLIRDANLNVGTK